MQDEPAQYNHSSPCHSNGRKLLTSAIPHCSQFAGLGTVVTRFVSGSDEEFESGTKYWTSTTDIITGKALHTLSVLVDYGIPYCGNLRAKLLVRAVRRELVCGG